MASYETNEDLATKPCKISTSPPGIIYSTLDITGTAAKIFLGNTAPIGDPKPDPIFVNGKLVNTYKTVKTGEEGASPSSSDSINVEIFIPI